MADEELKTYTFYKIEFAGSRYIGKTTNLKTRQRLHRSACFNPKSNNYGYKLYKKLRQLGVTKDEIICQKLIIVKNLTKKEAALHERDWYEHLKPDLNSDVPNRSTSEYREENRDEKNRKAKEYWNENREELKRKASEYYVENRDEIIRKVSERWNENRDEINRKGRERWAENKEEKNRKARERYAEKKEEIKRKKRERYAAKKAQN